MAGSHQPISLLRGNELGFGKLEEHVSMHPGEEMTLAFQDVELGIWNFRSKMSTVLEGNHPVV